VVEVIRYPRRVTVAQTGNVQTVAIGTTLDALAWPLLAANAMTMTGAAPAPDAATRV
jgi:hypothetical protein